MTPDAGELMALADRLEAFCKVLESARRCDNKSISVWSGDPEVVAEAVTALRIAASQPDREAVARGGRIEKAIVNAYFAIKSLPIDGLGWANTDDVEWPIRDQLADELDDATTDVKALLSLLSVQVDGEQNGVYEFVPYQVASPGSAPIADSSEVGRGETGWLIEKDDPPVYAVFRLNDYDDHWTTDAGSALRFARRTDAQAFADHYGWTSPPVRVVEHMWDDGKSIALSAPVAETDADAPGDTKESDVGCNCSWGCVEADNCCRKPGPSDTKSAPLDEASHNSGERDPSVMPDYSGAGTTLSAEGMREAAQAVIDRWDTPKWKDAPATAMLINNLRAALSALPVQSGKTNPGAVDE